MLFTEVRITAAKKIEQQLRPRKAQNFIAE